MSKNNNWDKNHPTSNSQKSNDHTNNHPHGNGSNHPPMEKCGKDMNDKSKGKAPFEKPHHEHNENTPHHQKEHERNRNQDREQKPFNKENRNGKSK